MQADEYQEGTGDTAVYMESFPQLEKEDLEIIYLVLGLVEEAGEVAGKLKKALRAGMRPTDLVGDERILKEFGGVAWYFARASLKFGFRLTQVFSANRKQLLDRKSRGVLKGKGLEGGDDR